MRKNFFSIWLRPFLVVLFVLMGIIALGAIGDRCLLLTGHLDNSLYRLLLPPAVEVPGLLGMSVEFLAAIVGIAITVASILVQLSATRYSSRVIDLFIEDRVNLAVYCLLIVTPLYGVWLAYIGGNLLYPTTHLILFKGLTMFSIMVMMPYFNYLFHFLRPENIVHRIQGSVRLKHLTRAPSPPQLDRLQNNLIGSVTQLSDVVSNSISNSDMHLALLSIGSLKSLAADYCLVKSEAPSAWFNVPPRTFLGFEEISLLRLARDRTWVEMHCLKQFELILILSLNRFREISAAIAHRTRDLGMLSLTRGDEKAVELTVLFFNTYLRHAINAFDIRTMFHTFYHYRLLAEGCLNQQWRELLKKIAWYFKYYGQECERRGVSFAMEIAAYDLRVLVEQAYLVYPAVVDDLLIVFLDVDHAPDTESEKSQRGVRKNQAILAAFFLAHGEQALARRIFDDMQHEDCERMASIARELEPLTSQDFWEIQERGSNFYYFPPENMPHLQEFFSWFQRREAAAVSL